jgi:diamine N-acetyltransferase
LNYPRHPGKIIDMNPIRFKKAKKSDIPLIRSLAHEIWNAHFPGIISQEQIDYMLESMYSSTTLSNELEQGVKWKLIMTGDQTIGYYAGAPLDRTRYKLHKLYLRPGYHGQGIGQYCLEHIAGEAEKLGYKQLLLYVNRNNAKAIKAYIRAGFSLQKEEDTRIGGGFVLNDWVMVKDL